MLSQQPENQKNLLLAIVLSVGVMAAWNFFYAAPKYKEEQERLKRAQQSQSEMQSGTVAPGTTAPAAGAGPAVAPPSQVTIAPPPGLTRDAAVGLAPRIGIETPALTGSISLKGGRIDDLSLVRYRETVDPKSPNVVLFSPADAPSPYFAEYGWSAGPAAAGNPAPKLPDRDTMWSPAGAQSLTPTTPIQMTWDNGQGLKFRRSIGVDADYMFKITDTVENATAADVTLFPYARIYRYGTPTVQGIYILHEGMVGVLGEQSLKEYTYSELQKDGGGGAFQKISGGWLGFTDKYWAAVLIPNQTSVYAANMHQVGKKSDTTKESYQADVVQDGVMIPAGGVRSIEGQLFAGAKQVQLIDGYKSTYGIQKFDLMIDWGWFWFFTKPLFYLMEIINRVVRNFGVTIILLTLIVKGAFFPLANKSYKSMAMMKKLQPEMEKIRERFKDDKARQQQAMMELYKQQKVNPMAGCLPILIQIPVFFALYKVLFVTIDMRHAPFFGWIRDLSAPDPTSFTNLFGLMPWPAVDALLFGHTIGLWAIVMGITMWLQMQLNPQQPDPVQQQVFNWMPVMFTFMLSSFASGLVIYWTWNNLLSITQQYLIMKGQGVDVPLVGNLKRTWAVILALPGKLVELSKLRK